MLKLIFLQKFAEIIQTTQISAHTMENVNKHGSVVSYHICK